MGQRDRLCRNETTRSLYRAPGIHQHRDPLGWTKSNLQSMVLGIADVTGNRDVLWHFAENDTVVVSVFEVADQSVFNVLQRTEIDAEMESIERCVPGALGFGGGDSLVRIGPSFAEEFQSDRGVYQGQWTARED